MLSMGAGLIYDFIRNILSIPYCPIPFCLYTILSIPFCPYHFVLEPLDAVRVKLVRRTKNDCAKVSFKPRPLPAASDTGVHLSKILGGKTKTLGGRRWLKVIKTWAFLNY